MKNNTAIKITIELKGPFKFFGEGPDMVFASPVATESGIYFWTTPYKDSFLISYVGITNRSFYKRFGEHVGAIYSGEYRIDRLDPNLKEEEAIIYPGIFGASSEDKIKIRNDFFINQKEYLRQLQEMIYQERIFLCPLNVDTRILERIEAALYEHLHRQPFPAGSYIEDIVHLMPKRPREKELTVRFKSDFKIEGLPKELKI